MLEKLADRLSFERTANGIRVEIPARLGFITVFLAVWLAFWTFGGPSAMKEFKASGNLFLLPWLVGWLFGEIFAAASILWSLGGKVTILLDPRDLVLTRSVFGFPIRNQSISTGNIRNLRFIPALGAGRGSRQSEIRLEANGKTIKFASGIEDAEAFALIDKMLEVYPFPKDRALDYMASS